MLFKRHIQYGSNHKNQKRITFHIKIIDNKEILNDEEKEEKGMTQIAHYVCERWNI